MGKLLAVSVLLMAVMVTPNVAIGQDDKPRITGVVVDAAGLPIEEAIVELVRANRKSTTPATGRFQFDQLRKGKYWLFVRRIGYLPIQQSLTVEPGTRDFRIVLEAVPVRLDDIEVEALSGLYQRRMRDFTSRSRSGWGGRFLTADDLARTEARRLGDVVIRYMPFKSLYTMDLRGGDDDFGQFEVGGATSHWDFLRQYVVGAGATPRYSWSRSTWRYRPDCPPAIALNGGGILVGMAVNDFDPEEVEAIEIYREGATLPIEYQFAGRATCGLVVIWLKSWARAGSGG